MLSRARSEMRLPLQGWVALLVLAVTLPLGALVVWNAQQSAEEAEAVARRHIEGLARQVAAETGGFVDDTRRTLQRVATRPDVIAMDETRCGSLYANFRELLPRYASLVHVDRDGNGVCSSIPFVPGVQPYRDLDWFREPMRGAPFVIDRPRIGRVTGARIVVAAVPVRDAAGNTTGVLASAIDLDRFPIPLLRAEELPEGVVVAIVNHAGTVVARSHERERIGGPAFPVVREMQRVRSATATPMTAADGKPFLVALAPVTGVAWDAVVLYPADNAVAAARETLQRTLVVGSLVLLAVWALAALVAQRLLGPVRALAGGIEALGRGVSGTRVAAGGPREIARIGENFNAMADRREADERALREREAHYRALFETSSDAIVGIDADAQVVFANPAIEPLSGWRPAELVGRDLGTIQPEAMRAAHRAALQGVVERGASGRGGMNETRLLHRDGHEVPVEVRFSRVELGERWLFVGFLRDISDRQAALASLRESEQRFRAMADSSPVLIWTTDAGGHATYFNATWLAFCGRTLDGATAAGWLDGVHPDEADAVAEHWRDGYARRVGGTLEYRRRRHDGAWRWLLDARAPRFADDGRFLGFVGSAVDIHDRVVGEARIRRLTSLYAVLSEANEAIARGGELVPLLQSVCDVVVRETGMSSACVALCSDDGTQLRTVAAAGEFAAYLAAHSGPVVAAEPAREGPGSLALRTGAPVISNRRDEDARVRPIENPAMRAAVASTAVFPLRRGGQPAGILALYARPADSFDDELVSLFALLAEDLSFALESHGARMHRDAAEDALRRLNADLERRVAERTRSLEAANREMEAFTYSVSHDLRAPLRGISGFAELLAESAAGQLDDTARGYLDRVKAAAARMARLIDDLLNLSRVSRQAIGRSDVDVSRIAAEVLRELALAHPERTVAVDVAPGLAAHADPGLARIVLDNLLGNAWKFTAKTTAARIAVEPADLGGRRAFTVRDNGAGFDPAFADKLFAPFQRLHTEREFPGTGIGLALVQRIVHRHGGEVTVTAAPGQGAAFTFTFDAAVPALPDEHA